MNLLHQSFGHGLALALFFDGAGTLALSICNVEKSFASRKFVCGITNRQDLSKAFYESARDTLYGFSPFMLRHLVKASFTSYGTAPVWIAALTSSAILGAYKYWSKGGSAYIGAYNNVAYALATLLELDQTFLGSAWTTSLIEGAEGVFKSGLKIEDFLAGAISGVTSWILLDGIGLYNKFTDNIAPAILASTLCPQVAAALVGAIEYNLCQKIFSRDPLIPRDFSLGILLCASALMTPAATPMLLVSAAGAAFSLTGLSRITNQLCEGISSIGNKTYIS